MLIRVSQDSRHWRVDIARKQQIVNCSINDNYMISMLDLWPLQHTSEKQTPPTSLFSTESSFERHKTLAIIRSNLLRLWIWRFWND